MEISDIKLEMELGGVDSADVAEILELCNSKGFNSEIIDDELVRRGYDKIFTVNYDDYDDWEEENDEYSSVERFPYKKSFKD